MVLLPQFTLKVLGSQHLLFHTILLNQFNDLLIFPFGPQLLDKIWIHDPQPPVLTLLVSAFRKVPGTELPVLLFKLPHRSPQLLILIMGSFDLSLAVLLLHISESMSS